MLVPDGATDYSRRKRCPVQDRALMPPPLAMVPAIAVEWSVANSHSARGNGATVRWGGTPG
jgi:hypothetical protein